MRRAALAIVFIVASVDVTACKKHRQTDHLPSDRVTVEERLIELGEANAGKNVGSLLRRPRVVFDGGGVSVNGERVLVGSEVESTMLARLEKLRLYLREVRNHWKQIQPAAGAWEGTIDLEVDGGVTTFALANVMTAARNAGYWRFHVKLPTMAWDVAMYIQGPPRLDESPPPSSLLALRVAKGTYQAELRTQGACKKPPAVLTRTAPLNELPAIVREHCAATSPCHAVIEPSIELVANVIPTIAPTFVEGGERIDLSWGTELPFVPLPELPGSRPPPEAPGLPPGSAAPSPAGSTGSAARTKALASAPRLGAIRVDERLSGEAVRLAVEGHRDALRACYATGLATNPTLVGRITAKLTVDVVGNVGEVCAESDLPDAQVVACIEAVFAKMTFAAPRGGVAGVKVPLMFTPPS